MHNKRLTVCECKKGIITMCILEDEIQLKRPVSYESFKRKLRIK